MEIVKAFSRHVHEVSELLGVFIKVQAVVSVVLRGEEVAFFTQIVIGERSVAEPEEELRPGHGASDNRSDRIRFLGGVKLPGPTLREAPAQEEANVRAAVFVRLPFGEGAAVMPTRVVVLHGRGCGG